MNRLSIVVPCYNEEEVLPETSAQLTKFIENMISKGLIAKNSFILLVDDGSKDKTWTIIEELNKNNKYIEGVKLAHNAGHQNALLSGLIVAKKKADMAISIDADLQDDIQVMEQMIQKFIEGNDIVYGVRNDRTTDSFFKKFTAQGFYKVMNLFGVNTIYNHADFRLMSRRALEQLSKYKERNLFLRGIVPLLGYKTDCVYYARKERFAGESKYPLKKMLSFAFDGITSFSIKPITMILVLGFISVIISVLAILYSLWGYFHGNTISGWSSMFISIWFLGGVQLLSVGIIGEYIGKTYIEVKERPRYNIENILESINDEN